MCVVRKRVYARLIVPQNHSNLRTLKHSGAQGKKPELQDIVVRAGAVKEMEVAMGKAKRLKNALGSGLPSKVIFRSSSLQKSMCNGAVILLQGLAV